MKDPGLPRDGDLLGWMHHAARLGSVACVVPVTFEGSAGIAHAAFTDHGGLHDQTARSRNGNLRAYVAIDLCSRTYQEAVALGADAE